MDPTPQIQRVRALCLALPGATEQVAWGEPTWRVRKRMFAMFATASTHHGQGMDSLWSPAPLGVQEMLVRSAPERYFVPPYVGMKGWVGIRLPHIDDAELRGQLVQAYCMLATRKQQAMLAELDAGPPSA